MPWTMPHFEAFIDFDIFARAWAAMVQLVVYRGPEDRSTIDTKPTREIGSIDYLLKLMMTAWVDCALSTIARDAPRKGQDWDWQNVYWDQAKDLLQPFSGEGGAPHDEHTDQALDAYEDRVYGALHRLHGKLRVTERAGRRGEDTGRQWANLRTWMEVATVLLTEPEYLGTVAPPAHAPGGSDGERAPMLKELDAWRKQKRAEHVRRAIRRALRASGRREDDRELDREVTAACRIWFQAVDSWKQTPHAPR
jgi:hypothetical protein